MSDSERHYQRREGYIRVRTTLPRLMSQDTSASFRIELPYSKHHSEPELKVTETIVERQSGLSTLMANTTRNVRTKANVFLEWRSEVRTHNERGRRLSIVHVFQRSGEATGILLPGQSRSVQYESAKVRNGMCRCA